MPMACVKVSVTLLPRAVVTSMEIEIPSTEIVLRALVIIVLL